MAARATQSPHPDVEVVQAEVAVLEGQKKTLQNETLGIAADKKRLIEEGEAAKARIEEEVARKHREGGAELETLDNEIARMRLEKEKLEKTIEEAKVLASTHPRIVMAHTDAREALEKTEKDLASKRTELAALLGTEKELGRTVAGHQSLISSIEKDTEALDSKVSEATVALAQKNIERTELETLLGDLRATCAHLEKEKGLKTQELDRHLSGINERLGARLTLENDIAALEKRMAEKEGAIKEQDAALSERMGAAARLETHVNDKLVHLKELENRFTTEHLARMGYQKTE